MLRIVNAAEFGVRYAGTGMAMDAVMDAGMGMDMGTVTVTDTGADTGADDIR